MRTFVAFMVFIASFTASMVLVHWLGIMRPNTPILIAVVSALGAILTAISMERNE